MLIVRLLSLVFLFSAVLVLPMNAAIQVIASSGETAPDGNGIYAASGFGGTVPDLNNAGAVTFRASFVATDQGTDDDTAIIRASLSESAVIARESQSVSLPSGGDVEIDEFYVIPVINDSGQVAFRASLLRSDTVTSSNDSVIFSGDTSELTFVAREGQEVAESGFSLGGLYPGTYLSELSLTTASLSIDEESYVSFIATDDNTPSIFYADSSGLTRILTNLEFFPDETHRIGFNGSSQSRFADVGFASVWTNAPRGVGFMTVASDGTKSFVAQAGEIAPDGVSTFNQYIASSDLIPVNSQGEITFRAYIDTVTGREEALFAGTAGDLRELARVGQSPDGESASITDIDTLDINESGRVAFVASYLYNTRSMLWLEDSDQSGNVRLIMEKGQALDLPGVVIREFGDVVMNGEHELAVEVLLDSESVTRVPAVLYYNDLTGMVQRVVTLGETLQGSSINSFIFYAHDLGGRRALNENSQVVFSYSLANDQAGIALWSPNPDPAFVELSQQGEGTVMVDERFEDFGDGLYRAADPEGADYSLVAEPADGWYFAGWEGDLTSSSGELEFTLSRAQTLSLSAVFEQYPPEIISQPASSYTYEESEHLVLTLEASGADLEFEWFKDGDELGTETERSIELVNVRDPGRRLRGSLSVDSSESASTLEITNLLVSDSGTYQVRVTNPAGFVESREIVVVVGLQIVAPVVVAQSELNQSFNEGESLLLSVDATGDDLTYQWYHGGEPVDFSTREGARIVTTAARSELQIDSLTLADAGSYYVSVSNSAGADESAEMVIQVIEEAEEEQVWYSGAVTLGGNWLWSNWFGTFSVANDPWIYHAQHGWLYPFASAPESIYFWDGEMSSIIWTSEAVYPAIYRFSDGKWLFYDEGSSAPRWFVDLITGQWERW